MKIPNCPNCGRQENLKVITSPPFTLYKCGECKNAFLYPIPTNLSKYYPKMYWQHLGKLSQIRQCLHNFFQKRRVGWVKEYIKGGDILDVGCGEGIFGEYLGDSFNITNLEAPFAEVKNKSVIKKDFLKWKPNKKYDAIIFLESLEHVRNPQKYLAKSAKLLKKGGFVFVEYPRFDSLESKILGAHWLHRDLPRHLVHLTQDGLAIIAKREGFTKISQKGFMSFEYAPYILLASVMNALDIKLINFRKLSFANILKIIFILVFLPMASILEYIFYAIGEAPQQFAVFKKK